MKLKSFLILFILVLLTISCTAERSARHFNSLASSAGAMPDEVIRALGIKPGMSVADIGSGGGYYTLRFSEAVGPRGTVYAVDIDPKLLAVVRREAEKKGRKNIKYVLARPEDSGLAPRSLDLVFLRNVFHELPEQVEYFRTLTSRLRPGARVAIIDYKPGFLSTMWHNVSEDDLVSKMKEAGFVLLHKHSFLSTQSFNIFVIAGARSR